MGMVSNGMVEKWWDSLPKTDGIYRLMEEAENSSSLKTRIWAISALGISNDPRAVQSLIACSQEKNPEIRLCAIEGLKHLRSGRSVEVLVSHLKNKQELPEIRRSTADALATIRSIGALLELRNRYEDLQEDDQLRTFIGDLLSRVKQW